MFLNEKRIPAELDLVKRNKEFLVMLFIGTAPGIYQHHSKGKHWIRFTVN